MVLKIWLAIDVLSRQFVSYFTPTFLANAFTSLAGMLSYIIRTQGYLSI